jgi:hypothetical protein
MPKLNPQCSWLHLEMQALRKFLRLNKLIRVGPWSDGVSALVRGDIRPHFLFPSPWMWENMNRKKTMWGDTKNRHNWPSDFQPQNYEKINCCCLSHSACDVLLWQPCRWMQGPTLSLEPCCQSGSVVIQPPICSCPVELLHKNQSPVLRPD